MEAPASMKSRPTVNDAKELSRPGLGRLHLATVYGVMYPANVATVLERPVAEPDDPREILLGGETVRRSGHADGERRESVGVHFRRLPRWGRGNRVLHRHSSGRQFRS